VKRAISVTEAPRPDPPRQEPRNSSEDDMANVYFATYATAADVAHGRPHQFGAITIDGAASASISAPAGFPANHRCRVRLLADGKCFVDWGDTPNPQGDGSIGIPLGAENPEYVEVQAGHALKAVTRA
jgi:hypothetical protein